MKYEREHPMREAAETVHALKDDFIKKQEDKVNTVKKEREDFINCMDRYRDQRELQDNAFSKFSEQVYDDLLSSALKGIYISSLQENHELSDRALAIASDNIDHYIKENGGSAALMNKMKGKTYLLDNIVNAVKEAHDETMDKVDKEDPETYDLDDKAKEDMFDKLENDQDTDHAIEVIATRVGDAETNFIKKNSDDKQKISTIVDKANSAIKDTEQDPDMNQDEKNKDIEFAQKESMRMISNVRYGGFTTVMENMVLDNTEFIMKDKQLKESYTEESGKLDMAGIMESSLVMYGFLEFVNTIQLDNVDTKYIKNILEN